MATDKQLIKAFLQKGGKIKVCKPKGKPRAAAMKLTHR